VKYAEWRTRGYQRVTPSVYIALHFYMPSKRQGTTLWVILTTPCDAAALPTRWLLAHRLTYAPGRSGIQERNHMHSTPPSPHPVSEAAIAQLVGQVYEIAPPAERRRLLEHLIKPLGVLSLVAVANGIFASLRFRSGWPDMQIRIEDAQSIQARDVIALVNYVQQVSVHAVDGLASVLASSPVMTGSAAASLLITLLLQRSRTRRAEDREE